MKDLDLVCPECKGNIINKGTKLACNNNHTFYVENGVFNLLPKSLDEITSGDAHYHAGQKETWIDQNQIDAARNLFFHKEVVDFISDNCNSKSNILEIGGGVGFDLELFLDNKSSFHNYIFSEISEKILFYVCSRINDNRINYCCIDSQNIPFEKNQFDFVYIIAALHHFPDIHKALEEITRVTKKDGFIVFGIEPNKRWFKLVPKIKQVLSVILPKKDHSPADEQMLGFSSKDFKEITSQYNLELVKLESVWFFCGLMQYGLEFLYRVFHLERRIKIPVFLEKIIVYLDKFLSVIPGIKDMCWHYTAIYQKK